MRNFIICTDHLMLTNSVMQRSQETGDPSGGQEISCIVWNSEVHSHVHKCRALNPTSERNVPRPRN
jgi:hypothetical protein